MELYNNSNPIEEIFNLNKEYIKGNITETPYMWGSLDFSNKNLVNDLLEMYDNGLFTVNSQTGKEEEILGEYLFNDNVYCDSIQKPYNDFYMKDYNKALVLYENLIRIKNVEVVMIFKDCIKYTDGFKNGSINVIIKRTYKEINGPKPRMWKVYARISKHSRGYAFIPLIDNNFTYVSVLYNRYNSIVNVERLVLDNLPTS